MKKSKVLGDLKFESLNLASIKPRGWLKNQLEIQAQGLTGYLDEFWSDLKNSKWLGGDKEGWENGPYYLDGLIPLAYLLNNERLIAKVEKWIEAVLESQKENGWIGPIQGERKDRKEYDPWPNFIILKALKQYYEVSGDQRAIKAVLNFCSYLNENIVEKPLFQWGKFRWGEIVYIIHWLYEEKKGDNEWLLNLAYQLFKQGYDWRNHFNSFKYKKAQPITERLLETHVVNNAMGIKNPGIWFRQSQNKLDEEAVDNALINLDKFHGQITGVFTGDEHLAGKSPTRGTELCAVVEYMFSLEKLITIFGRVDFADKLEKIAFNALPATFTSDMWAHQYDQQVNQVICNVSEKNWSNGPDANIFGLEPNFGCCTANMHQGWPKLVNHLFMQDNEGIAAIIYSPCEVVSSINGQEVKIVEETEYPFRDKIKFNFDLKGKLKFSFKLRIPNWSQKAVIKINEKKMAQSPAAGSFYKIERDWRKGDSVTLEFNPEIEVERRYGGAVGISRASIVFSKSIKAEWKQIGGDLPHADWELYPLEPWNLGIDIESLDSLKMNYHENKSEKNIFSPQNPHLSIKITGGFIKNWILDQNVAGNLPSSPFKMNDEEKIDFKLIPYGCTNLRITEFPLIKRSI